MDGVVDSTIGAVQEATTSANIGVLSWYFSL